MVKVQKGFTLIELMIVIAIIGIVIAIIGILAAVAVPQYTTYTKRARFSEVVLATTAFKTPAEIAVQTGRATTEAQLNAEDFGIPPNVVGGASVGEYVDTVEMSGGIITAAGTAAVDSSTYVIYGTVTNGGIRWKEDTTNSTCMASGLC